MKSRPGICVTFLVFALLSMAAGVYWLVVVEFTGGVNRVTDVLPGFGALLVGVMFLWFEAVVRYLDGIHKMLEKKFSEPLDIKPHVD